MVNNDYARAYTEVLEILKYIPNEDFDKIPNEKIEFYKKYMDKEYIYVINEALEFDEQNISDIAKAILANMFRDFWATENQKTRILEKERCDLENIEKEKREKYSPDHIFKNKQCKIDESISTELIEYKKEKWYSKFISYMKNIFKKNR